MRDVRKEVEYITGKLPDEQYERCLEKALSQKTTHGTERLILDIATEVKKENSSICQCPYYVSSEEDCIHCLKGYLKKHPYRDDVEKHKDKYCKDKYRSCYTYQELQKASK